MKNAGLVWLREVEQIGRDNGYHDKIHGLVRAVRPFMRRSMVYRTKMLIEFKNAGLMGDTKLALLEMLLLAHEPGYKFKFNPEMNELTRNVA